MHNDGHEKRKICDGLWTSNINEDDDDDEKNPTVRSTSNDDEIEFGILLYVTSDTEWMWKKVI